MQSSMSSHRREALRKRFEQHLPKYGKLWRALVEQQKRKELRPPQVEDVESPTVEVSGSCSSTSQEEDEDESSSSFEKSESSFDHNVASPVFRNDTSIGNVDSILPETTTDREDHSVSSSDDRKERAYEEDSLSEDEPCSVLSLQENGFVPATPHEEDVSSTALPSEPSFDERNSDDASLRSGDKGCAEEEGSFSADVEEDDYRGLDEEEHQEDEYQELDEEEHQWQNEHWEVQDDVGLGNEPLLSQKLQNSPNDRSRFRSPEEDKNWRARSEDEPPISITEERYLTNDQTKGDGQYFSENLGEQADNTPPHASDFEYLIADEEHLLTSGHFEADDEVSEEEQEASNDEESYEEDSDSSGGSTVIHFDLSHLVEETTGCSPFATAPNEARLHFEEDLEEPIHSPVHNINMPVPDCGINDTAHFDDHPRPSFQSNHGTALAPEGGKYVQDIQECSSSKATSEDQQNRTEEHVAAATSSSDDMNSEPPVWPEKSIEDPTTRVDTSKELLNATTTNRRNSSKSLEQAETEAISPTVVRRPNHSEANPVESGNEVDILCIGQYSSNEEGVAESSDIDSPRSSRVAIGEDSALAELTQDLNQMTIANHSGNEDSQHDCVEERTRDSRNDSICSTPGKLGERAMLFDSKSFGRRGSEEIGETEDVLSRYHARNVNNVSARKRNRRSNLRSLVIYESTDDEAETPANIAQGQRKEPRGFTASPSPGTGTPRDEPGPFSATSEGECEPNGADSSLRKTSHDTYVSALVLAVGNFALNVSGDDEESDASATSGYDAGADDDTLSPSSGHPKNYVTLWGDGDKSTRKDSISTDSGKNEWSDQGDVKDEDITTNSAPAQKTTEHIDDALSPSEHPKNHASILSDDGDDSLKGSISTDSGENEWSDQEDANGENSELNNLAQKTARHSDDALSPSGRPKNHASILSEDGDDSLKGSIGTDSGENEWSDQGDANGENSELNNLAQKTARHSDDALSPSGRPKNHASILSDDSDDSLKGSIGTDSSENEWSDQEDANGENIKLNTLAQKTMKRVIVIDDSDGDSQPSLSSAESDEENVPPPILAYTRQETTRAASKKSFRRHRDQHTTNAFTEFNNTAFDGVLSGVTVTWSAKLRTTAGRAVLRAQGLGGKKERVATIELSTKVIDDIPRLRATLLHEMCHAAAWIVDDFSTPPHGKMFKKWAKIAMGKIPGIEVTTTHDYDIDFKYKWVCTTPGCKFVVQRHSRSVDVTRQCCGRCRGKLQEISRKQAPPNPYNLFVKEHSKEVRTRLLAQGGSVSQAEVMKECARMWRELKDKSNT